MAEISKTIDKETWRKIYYIFLENGFSKEEATTAADENLNPEPEDPSKWYLQVKMIKKILKNRKLAVTTLVKYGGRTWEEAVDERDNWRRDTCKDKGIDEMDILQGET